MQYLFTIHRKISTSSFVIFSQIFGKNDSHVKTEGVLGVGELF